MLSLRVKNRPVRKEHVVEGASAAVQAYLDLAHGVYELGRTDQAVDLLERAADAAQELGEDNPQRAGVLNRLGVLRKRQGRHSEAERLLKRAAGILERAVPQPRAELSTVLSNLGAVYRSMGQAQHARASFERALKMAEDGVAPGMTVAWTLDQIGDLEISEDNPTAAVFALRRALAIKEQALRPDDWDMAVTLDRLADGYLKQGRFNEAEAFLLRVMKIREQVLGWDDPGMAKPLTRLARLYNKQRKSGRAEQLAGYALKLFTAVLPPDHDEVIACLQLLSEIYQGLSRFGDSDAVSALARGLVNGSESPKKLRRFTFPTPPRFSGPDTPVFATGAAG